MSNPETVLSPERIRADVAELVGCDPADIAPDDNLFDLGIDSVRMMMLVERWRSAGASQVEFPDLAERAELSHWIAVLTGAGEATTSARNTAGEDS
ncbi:phosphopantetheine-binding protein [Saccharomonospora sp.]|uniref:phosphopantetheine-binding protein n=1 Tax=Saccharomonospora sp. TaxID=33913 RepID=UPI002634E7F5|nr:phosphopantetheine-binding protein [Saccharomonospora sp.]